MSSAGTQTRVRSRDGTEIAEWTSGDGPPLVQVHGTPADHTRFHPLLPYLEQHVGDVLAPEAFAAQLLAFLREPG